eukprot:3096259-Amphidinium_carterae.1
MWQLRMPKSGQDGAMCLDQNQSRFLCSNSFQPRCELVAGLSPILGQGEFLKLIEACFATGANLEDVKAAMKMANIVVLGSTNVYIRMVNVTLQGSSNIHVERTISRMVLEGTGMDPDGEQVDVDKGDLDWSIHFIALCFNRRFKEVKDGFKTQIPHDAKPLLKGFLEDQTELKSEFSGLSGNVIWRPRVSISSPRPVKKARASFEDDEMSLTEMLEMEVNAMRAVPEDSQ